MTRFPFNSGSIRAAAATLTVLGGLAAYRVRFQSVPPQAGEYHRKISRAAEALPTHIGSWLGHDTAVSGGAVALLHPNVIVSRQFLDLQTGRTVNFLLVQCADARDILGHYPPVCYVVHGWSAVAGEPRTWTVGDWPIDGVAYEFARTRPGDVAHAVVYDFMILPDGTTCRDMDQVEQSAKQYRTRSFGAAQVQLEFDATTPPAERDRIFALFVNANRPVLDLIRSGNVP